MNELIKKLWLIEVYMRIYFVYVLSDIVYVLAKRIWLYYMKPCLYGGTMTTLSFDFFLYGYINILTTSTVESFNAYIR